MAERVDSPQETRLRLCLVLAGLPVPEVNLTLGTQTHPIGRVDLVYQQFKLIIEYEGDQHRVDRFQWNIDIDRVEEFAAEGFLTVRITARRMRQPAAVVQRIFRELRNRGCRGPEPVFSAEWLAILSSSEQWRTPCPPGPRPQLLTRTRTSARQHQFGIRPHGRTQDH